VTVYAVQEPARFDPGKGKWLPKVNLQSAAGFGEVVTLIPHDHVNAALVTKPTLHKLRRALKDFSDDDYLLPVGDIVLCGMAMAVALRENRGRARVLRWNREQKRYDVVEVEL
jgi:hypothetical protein